MRDDQETSAPLGGGDGQATIFYLVIALKRLVITTYHLPTPLPDSPKRQRTSSGADVRRQLLPTFRLKAPPVAASQSLHIASLPKEAYRMEPRAVPRVVVDVLKTRALPVFQKFQQEGYVFNATGTCNDAIKISTELSTTNRVGYSIVNEKNQVVKKGATGDAKFRETKSVEKGIMSDGDRMVETFNMDLITQEMSDYVEKEWEGVVQDLVDCKDCPLPLRNLLEFYMNRGGAQIGIKPNFHLCFLESGSQFIDNITRGALHESLMCDTAKYSAREGSVRGAFEEVRDALKAFYGNSRVKVVMGSSWPTDASMHLKDGRARLHSTQVAMESILGEPVDMNETNMIPYGPTGDIPYFSIRYSSDDYGETRIESHCGV